MLAKGRCRLRNDMSQAIGHFNLATSTVLRVAGASRRTSGFRSRINFGLGNAFFGLLSRQARKPS
jgi:hypothetical protein